MKRLQDCLCCLGLLILGLVSMCYRVVASEPWSVVFREELPLLGHRNWIVIADAAYPVQVSPGIRVLATDESDPAKLCRQVIEAMKKAGHVTPHVYLDRELEHLSETDALGITAYRAELKSVLEAYPAQKLLHEELLKKLNQDGQAYRILVLKTKSTLPYSSVFIHLECGYWTSQKEARLRQAMK